MVADKISLFDKYQWQGNDFWENNYFMWFLSKYYVKWTMSEFQVTEGVCWILQKACAESRLYNFLLYSFKTKNKYIFEHF